LNGTARGIKQLTHKKNGYPVDVAGNGREALEKLREKKYALVLMDVQMPEMDGFEATRQIRNPESQVLDHDVPVIAMTAHALKGDREACLAAGMNDYMTKPIRRPQLLKMIAEYSQVPETLG